MSSFVRLATPVRTRAAPEATLPAGAVAASSAMASAMSLMVTSFRISEAEVTSTTVCGAATPRIEVRVTPSVNSRATISSANRASWSTPTGPEITTSVTGSRQAPRVTSGSSASSGSVPTPFAASSISAAARDMSQPGSNSSVIRARPSVERAVLEVTPSTARSAGSSAWTIPVSTSSAPAPSQRTLTVTLSITTSGKNCARIRGSVEIPTAISTTSSRLATVAWRVK